MKGKKKGQLIMDNQETLAILGTQDTGRRQTKQGAIKNGQYRDTGNIWVHKTQDEDKQNKGSSRMDNPETLATFGYTRHRTRANKTRGNQEWTIQRHWQH